jgi:Tol biopolymer transport system component
MSHTTTRFAFAILTVLFLLCLSITSSVVAQTTTRKVVYIRNSELWIMNLDGSAQTKVCNCSNAQRPVISPDNLKIAFEMSNNIYVVNTDGTNLLNLTPSVTFNSYASWSPDSAAIAFQSQGPGTLSDSIYRVNVNGSNLIRLTFGSDTRPSWSPDGKYIAFLNSYYTKEVFVVGSGGGATTRLSYWNFAGSNRPVWSPDLALDSLSPGKTAATLVTQGVFTL